MTRPTLNPLFSVSGFRLLTLMIVIGFAPVGALAQTAAKDPPLPDPIKQLEKDGAALRYLGRDLGYDGWIAVQNGQEQYFYVTPDQSAFFLGIMFNKNGRAITFDQVKRLQGKNDPILMDLMNAPSQVTAPAKSVSEMAAEKVAQDVAQLSAETSSPDKAAAAAVSASPAEQMFSDVSHANWFAVGKENAPVVYTFIDPLCSHCKDMLTALKKDYIDAGKVQLRVVPVGAISAESKPLAATLLAAKDAPDRLFRLMAGDISAVQSTTKSPEAPIDQNLSVMMKWDFQATPYSVYRGRDGTVKIMRGVPKTPDVLIKDLP